MLDEMGQSRFLAVAGPVEDTGTLLINSNATKILSTQAESRGGLDAVEDDDDADRAFDDSDDAHDGLGDDADLDDDDALLDDDEDPLVDDDE